MGDLTLKTKPKVDLIGLESETGVVITAEEIRQHFYCKRIPYLRHLHKNKVAKTYLQTVGTQFHEKEAKLRAQKIKRKQSKSKESMNSTASAQTKRWNKGDDGFVSLEEQEEILQKLGGVQLSEDDFLIPGFDYEGQGIQVNKLSDGMKAEDNEERYYDIYLWDKNLGLIGIVDYLGYKDDEAWPVEIKTGYEPRNKISNSHKFQLVALALLIESNFDLTVNHVKIHYLLLKKSLKFMISLDDRMKVLNAIREIRESIETETPPPPTKFPGMCHTCEYYNICGGI